MDIKAVQEVRSFRDIAQIRQSVRDAANRTRSSLDQLSPDPMVALYQLHFERHGRSPLKHRFQSLREQTYRTFNIMTILAAADHIFQTYPVGGLNLKLAQDFPSNFMSMAPRGSELPEIESVEKGKLEAQVFAATTSPSRITSNNVLRKRFRRLTESSAQDRLVYFYWPRTRTSHQQYHLNGDPDPLIEQQLRDDMENRRLQEMTREIECRDDLAREFYKERARELGIPSRKPPTHSEERKAGRDIQIWSLPLRDLL